MKEHESLKRSIHLNLIAGVAAILVVLGALGFWLGDTELSGAVVASGKLVVASHDKVVQHPDGGIVGELLVKEGDHVRAGQVLLRLDSTQTKANLAIVQHALDELVARKARLDAEKDGMDAATFPAALLLKRNLPDVAQIVRGETRLFELRRSSREGEKAQLKERIAQLRDEIEGLNQQADAKGRELVLIQRELKGVRELWEKNLVQLPRLSALERDAARLEGERGRLTASIAQSKGKIAEVELQIIQIDQTLRSEVGTELSDVRAKLSELQERKVAAEDDLKRIDVRAPQAGVVHELMIHTVGGVIAGGEPILKVVPNADTLLVEARVQPTDIDQIRRDQSAVLRLTAFSLRETPELAGEVRYVSADATEDERTGQTYYVTRISISESALANLKDIALVPGMPVEAFIQTEPRTVLSYLIKPLRDQFARAFRET